MVRGGPVGFGGRITEDIRLTKLNLLNFNQIDSVLTLFDLKLRSMIIDD